MVAPHDDKKLVCFLKTFLFVFFWREKNCELSVIVNFFINYIMKLRNEKNEKKIKTCLITKLKQKSARTEKEKEV
jgi:hypothetical protein